MKVRVAYLLLLDELVCVVLLFGLTVACAMLFARAVARAKLDSVMDEEISDLLGEVLGPVNEVIAVDSNCFLSSGTTDFWGRHVVGFLGYRKFDVDFQSFD